MAPFSACPWPAARLARRVGGVPRALLFLLGQGLELGLGGERGLGVVGPPHPLADRGGEVIRQPVSNVSDLVFLMPTSA
jgi:hypothetical protein